MLLLSMLGTKKELIMTKDINLPVLACCLLTLAFITTSSPVKSDHLNTSTVASLIGAITTTPGTNQTHATVMETSSNATIDDTTMASTMVISNLTEGTTSFPNTTTQDSTTLTKTMTAMPESTNNPQTSQSTAIWTPVTDGSSLTTIVPSTETPTSSVLTTHATQTTVDDKSTPTTTFHPSTEHVPPTINATSESTHNATQGSGLNNSERNMTILFSIVLGVFVLGLVMYMFNKYKHRIQYSHEPLYNTEDTDRFVADDDTLVISGGLYDGHEVYDNQPTTTTVQSQFRLKFLNEGERIPSF